MMPQHKDIRYGLQKQGSDRATLSNRTSGGTGVIKNLSWCLVGTFVAAAILSSAPDRAQAGGVLSIPFGDASFSGDPEVINNEYWPLNPNGSDGFGRTFIYEAETEDGCVTEVATIVGTKTLVGGEGPYNDFVTLEVEDIGYFDEDCLGSPVKEEHTLDWYRQGDDGNIWYLGELSRVYDEEGCEDDILPSDFDRGIHPDCYEGSWEGGKPPFGDPDGLVAQAGIVVPSDFPMGTAGEQLEPGTFYLQELAEEAMDVAKILKTDAKVKYKIDGATVVFHHCRVTKEYSSLAPGSIEQKNYCPANGGLVLIEEFRGGQTVLVELTDTIDP